MDSHNNLSTALPDDGLTQKAYTIGGVPIIFPYKAYPSQITMMDRIVKCLNKKQNCLLESPTGSGKSLALLCASLAWLKKNSKEIKEMDEMLYSNLNAYGVAVEDDVRSVHGSNKKLNFEKYKFNKCSSEESSGAKRKLSTGSKHMNICNSELNLKVQTSSKDSVNSISTDIKNPTSLFEKSENNTDTCENNHLQMRGIIYIDEDDMDDFQPVKRSKLFSDSQKSTDTSTLSHNYSLATPASPEKDESESVSKLKSVNDFEYGSVPTFKNIEENQTSSTLPERLPKIYFGTRTHKQIEQIIRELKKTPYKNVKMTILSSRERTCIHPKVSKCRNKNDGCDELINREEGPACKYYINIRRSGCYNAPPSAYDLEDFVSMCKRKQICPYYGARELLQVAEIVFCPYNYLVDPLIRSALSISLKGNIIIMDEAHNIEDSAREAASSCISVAQLQESIADILQIGQLKHDGSESYMHIVKVLENLKRWLENSQDFNDYVTFDSSSKVWSGDDMIAILEYVGLGPGTYPTFQNMYTKICHDENETEKEKATELQKLSGQTHIFLKTLTITLNYLYKEKLLFVPDYRCVVIKSKTYSEESSFIPYSQTSKRKSFTSAFEITLNFWCLNPSVAFSDMRDIHTLIVASGTLAPLTSFQSELGIPFHLSLEANHVICSKNIWVGTIGKGPSNNSLNGTFRSASTFIFQDDVGNLVLEVCSLIPHGVLCFLPSYGMLDKLVSRWQITGLWDKLLSKKVVLCEPRRGNEDFQQAMEEFYGAVKDSETNACGEVKGALFLAVCRGKVSEGLDFADNNARAVITIGIPFPNIKDAQVDLKKKYNDLHSSKRQVVTGAAWYEMQAFRALNQALGRCIRHKNDFGALIIVDERFQKYDRYVTSLSKWIKKEIKHYPIFYDALSSLSKFAVHMGLKNCSDTE